MITGPGAIGGCLSRALLSQCKSQLLSQSQSFVLMGCPGVPVEKSRAHSGPNQSFKYTKLLGQLGHLDSKSARKGVITGIIGR